MTSLKSWNLKMCFKRDDERKKMFLVVDELYLMSWNFRWTLMDTWIFSSFFACRFTRVWNFQKNANIRDRSVSFYFSSASSALSRGFNFGRFTIYLWLVLRATTKCSTEEWTHENNRKDDRVKLIFWLTFVNPTLCNHIVNTQKNRRMENLQVSEIF